MKQQLIFLLLLPCFDSISQRVSLGVLMGVNRNFEIRENFDKNRYPLAELTVHKGLNPSVGFYGEYKSIRGLNVGFEAKYMRIIQQSFQDSLGMPFFKGSNAVYECLNLTSYYIKNINNKFGVSLGVYDTIPFAYGTDLIPPPNGAYRRRLKIANHTFGCAFKVTYRQNKLNIESGFMYPFSPISKSISIAYVIPSGFIQVKYNFLKH